MTEMAMECGHDLNHRAVHRHLACTNGLARDRMK